MRTTARRAPAPIVLIVLLWAVATYNGFVRLRNLVQEAWRQIDVELHRRHDLIPNLVEAVKGHAAHERAVFDEVTRARATAAAPGAQPAEQAAQENVLTRALGRLLAVAEAYPQLQASETFPANVVANMFGFARAEYFETEDPVVRAAPRVDFGTAGA